MDDHFRTGKPLWCRTRHPGQLSIGIPPWVSAISTSKSWGVNRHIVWYTSPYPWFHSVCWCLVVTSEMEIGAEVQEAAARYRLLWWCIIQTHVYLLYLSYLEVDGAIDLWLTDNRLQHCQTTVDPSLSQIINHLQSILEMKNKQTKIATITITKEVTNLVQHTMTTKVQINNMTNTL